MSLSPNQYQDVPSVETTHHVSYTWISVLLPVVNSAAQQGDTNRDSNMELTETTFKHTQDCESSRMNWEKSSVQLLSETKENFTTGPDPNERDNNSCISYSSDLNLTGMTFHWRIIYRPAPAAPFDPGCLQTWFVGLCQTVGALSNKWHLASRVTFTLMEWSCFGLENGNGSGGGNLGVYAAALGDIWGKSANAARC